MKLYHYSSTLYPVLLTRRRSAPMIRREPGSVPGNAMLTQVQYEDSVKTAELYSDVGSYYDHVSFFFEPLPLDVMGDHFNNHHDFWFNGHLVYEHIVDTASLPKDIRYDVVETPSVREWWKTHGFDDDAPKAERLRVFAEMRKAKEGFGEIGYNVRQLESIGKLYSHGVFDYYKRQKASKFWLEGKDKYAAGVPHVMIYSQIGRFPVSSVSSCVIGSDEREDFNSVLKNFPTSQKW